MLLLLLLLLLRSLIRLLSRHDEDLEGVNAGFERCVFFREILVALLEVRDVFCCFREDGRLLSLAQFLSSGSRRTYLVQLMRGRQTL